MENFEHEIPEILKKMPGETGFYYKNLITGKTVTYNADKQFPPASIVKLPLLASIYLLKEKGMTDFEKVITVKEKDKMPACGAIPHITGDFTIDVKSLMRLMIVISDTSATNLLFNYYGAETIKQCFHELGLKGTQFNRAYFDDEKEALGINNYFVPEEMGILLEKIYRRELVSREASEEMEELLKKQQINHKMCGRLPMGYPVAHKTGEEEDKSHDIGIVFSEEPFVVCYAGYNTDIAEFEDFIRRTTEKLVKRTDPDLHGYRGCFKGAFV